MPFYSTEIRIRDEAWFTGNADITTTSIETYQEQAYGTIRSRISAIYNVTNLVTSNSNFLDSDAHRLLARIEELYAAGWLLIKEYGPDGTEQKEKGENKLQQAEDLVLAFFKTSNNPNPLRLVGNDWLEFVRNEISSSGPMESTGMTDRDHIFTTQERF